MTTPQKFLESFLRDKASVYAQANAHLAPVYLRCFGEPLSHRTVAFMLPDGAEEMVEQVSESAGSGMVITRRHFKTADIRTRYHLASVGGGWKITRIDRECGWCHASGRISNSPCQECDGEGWCDSAT